jgi:hypothetical protein
MRIGVLGLAITLAATLAACGGGDDSDSSTPTTVTGIVVDPTQADYTGALPTADIMRTAFRREMTASEPKNIEDPGLPSLCGKKPPEPRAIAGKEITFTTPKNPINVRATVLGWKPGELNVPWLDEAGVIGQCVQYTSNGAKKLVTVKQTTGHNLAVTIADLSTTRLVRYDFFRLEDYVATVRTDWDVDRVKLSDGQRGRLAMLFIDKAKPVLGIPW